MKFSFTKFSMNGETERGLLAGRQVNIDILQTATKRDVSVLFINGFYERRYTDICWRTLQPPSQTGAAICSVELLGTNN